MPYQLSVMPYLKLWVSWSGNQSLKKSLGSTYISKAAKPGEWLQAQDTQLPSQVSKLMGNTILLRD